jgi:hypothetical protein
MAAAASGDKVTQALAAIDARAAAILAAPTGRVLGSGKRMLAPEQSAELQNLQKLKKRISRIPKLHDMRSSLNPNIGKLEEEKLEHETKRLPIGLRYVSLCEESYGKQTCVNKVEAELAAAMKEVDKILGLNAAPAEAAPEDPAMDDLVSMFDSVLGGMKMGGGYRRRHRSSRKHRSAKKAHKSRKAHRRHRKTAKGRSHH